LFISAEPLNILRDSEAITLFKLAFNTVIVDVDGMKTEWSASSTTLFDMNRNEIITLPFYVLMLGMLELTKREYDAEQLLFF